MAVYVTGDCHAEFNKFSTKLFPEQKELTRDDFVIICGDFGLWHDNAQERYWLNWLNNKNFTTLFVDGNHENFSRLKSNEFSIVDFHGGKAHKIRDNIYHLMRGYVFNLCDKKFFAFGGASSHDIQDGVLYLEDYKDGRELAADYHRRTRKGEMVRINNISWWKDELPTEYEMRRGRENLKKVDYKVDYVISHCLPQRKVEIFYSYQDWIRSDVLTRYLDNLISNGLTFDLWCCGHYHIDRRIAEKYKIFYKSIKKIL